MPFLHIGGVGLSLIFFNVLWVSLEMFSVICLPCHVTVIDSIDIGRYLVSCCVFSRIVAWDLGKMYSFVTGFWWGTFYGNWLQSCFDSSYLCWFCSKMQLTWNTQALTAETSSSSRVLASPLERIRSLAWRRMHAYDNLRKTPVGRDVASFVWGSLPTCRPSFLANNLVHFALYYGSGARVLSLRPRSSLTLI